MHGRRTLAALLAVIVVAVASAGCGATGNDTAGLRVVASVGFLADMAREVGGERVDVTTLVPPGAELHAFEPGPAELRQVAESDLVVLNGGGLEGPLVKMLRGVGGRDRMIDACAGLKARLPAARERQLVDASATDPHFWLDPMLVVKYVDNLRIAFSKADPAGARTYRDNAARYQDELRRLDAWMRRRLASIPGERRLLVTDHQSYGYFADAFGFRIVGAVNPSVDPEAVPSARHVAALIRTIRREGVPAVFVSAGESPDLAAQVAREAGVKVVTGLRDHSLSGPEGPAATYITMMRYDTQLIEEALR